MLQTDWSGLPDLEGPGEVPTIGAPKPLAPMPGVPPISLPPVPSSSSSSPIAEPEPPSLLERLFWASFGRAIVSAAGIVLIGVGFYSLLNSSSTGRVILEGAGNVAAGAVGGAL